MPTMLFWVAVPADSDGEPDTSPAATPGAFHDSRAIAQAITITEKISFHSTFPSTTVKVSEPVRVGSVTERMKASTIRRTP